MGKIQLSAFALIGTFVFCDATQAAKVAAPSPAANTPTTWKYRETLDAPESAYFDVDSGMLYLSNIGGQATEKDGNGFILRINPTKQKDRLITKKFVTGLNAPKGMRSYKGTLYVSDIDELVAIDMKTGTIKKKIPVEGAKFLNDVAIDPSGVVYVSDMLTSKIHKITDGKVETFVEGKEFECPNGLYVHGGKLYVAAWGVISDPSNFTATPGHFYSLDLKTKERKNIVEKAFGNLDGLERMPDGSFVVSDWVASQIYRVTDKGQLTLMEIPIGKNTADIGFNPKTKILYIPFMGESSLSAINIAQVLKNH